MAKYYCSCRKGTRTKLDGNYHHTTYNRTETDAEGICVYCGHYAFARAEDRFELFPRHKGKITDMEVHKNVYNWEDKRLYHQYHFGCDEYFNGLARTTLLRDQRRIQGERKNKQRNKQKHESRC